MKKKSLRLTQIFCDTKYRNHQSRGQKFPHFHLSSHLPPKQIEFESKLRYLWHSEILFLILMLHNTLSHSRMV
jgi:hypothetical protein